MPKYEYTATHGVHLSDDGRESWAHFERDQAAEGVVYRFVTDDASVAERLRKLDDYGIVEVNAPPRRGRPPANAQ